MTPTAAVGVAECPPLSGHASGVFMRLFGARESSFPSAELGRTCRVPENTASTAAKNLGVAAAPMCPRIPQQEPRARPSRLSESGPLQLRQKGCEARAVSLL